jgi:hypothetical protein
MAQSEIFVDIAPALPLRLYDSSLARTDCNSPVRRENGRTLAFISHYQPIGHSYRRTGGAGFADWGAPVAVRLADDPDPHSGKWIEAVWRAPDGALYGWYHGEELAPCPQRALSQHIGALVSRDDGLTWHWLGELLRAAPQQLDCGYRNGFMVGGFGDFCVVPDRAGEYFYIHFSSYIATEAAQGIAVARYAIAQRDRPRPALELWSANGWQVADQLVPRPIWGVRRGWRHADPDAFWGPAIHFNRRLDRFVMLLNRTREGKSDYRPDGIYMSFAAALDDPTQWSAPLRIVRGGGWYPQAIGEGGASLGDEGDTIVDDGARLFISGFSAWRMSFRRGGKAAPAIAIDSRDWNEGWRKAGG